MTDLVKQNAISLRSLDFSWMMDNNGDKKDIYISIVSNMLDLPSKGILSANQVCASGHFYDDKPHKFGRKQSMFTTDGREIRMCISDGLAYPLFRCTTDEDMES